MKEINEIFIFLPIQFINIFIYYINIFKDIKYKY